MSMQDPVADMLTRIRNAQMAKLPTVAMPSSTLKANIAQVLLDEGFVGRVEVAADGAKKTLNITLRYHEGQPVIQEIKRFSRPGLRQYKGSQALPKVAGGLGVSIVSTSKGVMTDRQARAENVGGEVLCTVF
ncbi:MAG: 30S ribosomal protein S8 [Litorivicinus sp.]